MPAKRRVLGRHLSRDPRRPSRLLARQPLLRRADGVPRLGGDSAGVARCAGNERGAKQAARFLEEAGSDEYCATGFTGPECQLCVADSRHLVDGDKCDECLSVGAAAGRIVGLVLGLCVACGLAAYC